MKIEDALKHAKIKLGVNAKYAEFILLEWLNKDKTWLFLNNANEIKPEAYFRLVERFLRGEPFEYIFKKTSFYGLDFFIQKGVLIPRYDSEILLELCLNELKSKKYNKILEIGFGSGALSIVLAKLLKLKITACDISKKALSVAKRNADFHKVGHLIEFRLCDYRKIEEEFDFIFSNPPYIAYDYPLDIWVQREPKRALFGGKFGYEKLENIIKFAQKNKAKVLACEFGYNQRKILHKILHKTTFNAEFYKDTGGLDRAFLARGNH